jgi:hypothetical protein
VVEEAEERAMDASWSRHLGEVMIMIFRTAQVEVLDCSESTDRVLKWKKFWYGETPSWKYL